MSQYILYAISEIDWGIVTGTIALIFTAISLHFQRKHNKLSVKPIAIISIVNYENELAVYLQNKGTGPLIIKSLLFTDHNGKTEKSIIKFFGSDFKNVVWSTFLADIDGWAILPNESKALIKLEGNTSDKKFINNREKVREILAHIQVELLYQNIYGNEMPKKIRKLVFFAQ